MFNDIWRTTSWLDTFDPGMTDVEKIMISRGVDHIRKEYSHDRRPRWYDSWTKQWATLEASTKDFTACRKAVPVEQGQTVYSILRNTRPNQENKRQWILHFCQAVTTPGMPNQPARTINLLQPHRNWIFVSSTLSYIIRNGGLPNDMHFHIDTFRYLDWMIIKVLVIIYCTEKQPISSTSGASSQKIMPFETWDYCKSNKISAIDVETAGECSEPSMRFSVFQDIRMYCTDYHLSRLHRFIRACRVLQLVRASNK